MLQTVDGRGFLHAELTLLRLGHHVDARERGDRRAVHEHHLPDVSRFRPGILVDIWPQSSDAPPVQRVAAARVVDTSVAQTHIRLWQRRVGLGVRLPDPTRRVVRELGPMPCRLIADPFFLHALTPFPQMSDHHPSYTTLRYTKTMKLIIGLGNIGPHFDGTRHNVGFEVVSLFASRNNLNWQDKEKFKAHIAEGVLGGEKVIAVRPTTYYNLVGDAVQAIKHFYKIENHNILAVHDELALPFGVVRTRPDGSAAGNNGIKSIIAAIGDSFPRVRIGIANQFLPSMDAANFVLGRFSHEEIQKLADIKKHAATLVETFVNDTFEHTTTGL